MSRIGKLPITIPNGITVEIVGNVVKAKGPKGELSHALPQGIAIKKEGETLTILFEGTAEQKNLYGVSRTMVANCIEGVAKGFEKKLEIQGVGYKAQMKGKTLSLALGYSHPVDIAPPNGITVDIDQQKKNILTISGPDKQIVGEFAAYIRSLRPPEPYKGKGIRYVGENVRRKAGKAAVAKTGTAA